MAQQNNILFIRLRLLGDIIFTIPAIQIYRHYFPEQRIYYVVEESFKEIASLLPGIHQVIVIPRKMNLRQMWHFRRAMKHIGFSAVVDFHSGPKSAQLSFISGARKRIGYITPNRNWAYTHRTPRTFGRTATHSVYNQAKLLEHLGIHIDATALPPYPPITIPAPLLSETFQQVLATNSQYPAVVIHVGAGNLFRDWGLEHFAALLERLCAHQVRVYLVGNGIAEQQKAHQLAQRFPVSDLTGKISIPELLTLIASAAVYFGADSGPLHLASLTNTPIVAIYGPNIPEISGPWRSSHITILQKTMSCRPCTQRTCIYGIIPCMKNITVDDVYEAIYPYIQ